MMMVILLMRLLDSKHPHIKLPHIKHPHSKLAHIPMHNQFIKPCREKQKKIPPLVMLITTPILIPKLQTSIRVMNTK